MSAELLRLAAEKLRQHADNDEVTEGPWDSLEGGDRIVSLHDGEVFEYVVDEPVSNSANHAAGGGHAEHPGVRGGLGSRDPPRGAVVKLPQWLDRELRIYRLTILLRQAEKDRDLYWRLYQSKSADLVAMQVRLDNVRMDRGCCS